MVTGLRLRRHGGRVVTVPQGEDESDGEVDEPGDEGACITLIVYLDRYRTKGKLSNATRSATREAATSREITDEDDAEAQLRKAVHGKAMAALQFVCWLCKRGTSVYAPGLQAPRPGVSPGGDGG